MRCRTGFVLSIFVPLLAGCASQPFALSPVGPRPAAWDWIAASTGRGQLQVFTETDECEVDHDVPFFPHRDYQVYTTDGRYVRRVWNSQNHEDETPAIVNLPAGSYVIRADAEFYGLVKVPVVIRPNELTKVVLQPGWNPRQAVAKSDLVRMPDGYAVGWRAEQKDVP